MEIFSRLLKKSAAIFLAVLVMGMLFDGILVHAEANSFADVKGDSSFYIPITYLKAQKLIQGYSDGTFHPERLVNRAEALAMILKATGIKTIAAEEKDKNIDAENPIRITLPRSVPIVIENLATGEKTTLNDIKDFKIDVESGKANLRMFKPDTKKPFNDVSDKDWFFDIVKESKRLGFVTGYENGKYFRPNKNVNLAEALRMLFQTSDTKTDLSDKKNLPPGIEANEWYAGDIAYSLSRTMIMQQEDGSIFPPGQNLTRGELATVLYRFLKIKDGVSFGFASWYGDGLAKTKLTSGLEYKAKNLTAAHKSIPIGSIVKVTNASNGKNVDVVINDRGPFVTGRIIDLSKTAFSALESISAGVIQVQIEMVE